MKGKYFNEAMNTVNAGWLEIKLAKWFGKKSIHAEENITVKISRWRGKRYLIDTKKIS